MKIGIWKDIQEFEGIYQVSNLGDVRSLDRYVNGRHNNKAFRKGKILKPENVPAGYHRIELQKNGYKVKMYIHRLVAECFLPNPEKKPQVNHKNSIRNDNRVSNLEWVTAKENIVHGVEHGKIKYGEKHHFSKLNNSDVSKIIEMKNKGVYPKEISEYLGINLSTVGNVFYGTSWIKHQKDSGVIK